MNVDCKANQIASRSNAWRDDMMILSINMVLVVHFLRPIHEFTIMPQRHSQCDWNSCGECIYEPSKQLFTRPILVPTVRQVSSYHQWYLFLSQFLYSNLQRVRLALQVNEDWRVHAARGSSLAKHCARSLVITYAV